MTTQFRASSAGIPLYLSAIRAAVKASLVLLLFSCSSLLAQVPGEGKPDSPPADTVIAPGLPAAIDSAIAAEREGAADSLVVADSLVAPDSLVQGAPQAIMDSTPAVPAPGEQEVQDATGLRLGITRIPFPWRIEGYLYPEAVGTRRQWPGEMASDWLESNLAELDRTLDARRDTMWMAGLTLDKLPSDFDARRFFRFGPAAGDPGLAVTVGNERRIEIIPDALKGIADRVLQIAGPGQLGSRGQL